MRLIDRSDAHQPSIRSTPTHSPKQSNREGEEILFTHEGGVDVGDVDAKALRCVLVADWFLLSFFFGWMLSRIFFLGGGGGRSICGWLKDCINWVDPCHSDPTPAQSPPDRHTHSLQVPLEEQPDPEAIKKALLVHVPAAKQEFLATFLEGVLKLYRGLNFAYMEVNPLVRGVPSMMRPLTDRLTD